MKGSCHCGAVRFEVDRVEAPIGHCHCTTCRKTHSATYATTVRVPAEAFRWLSAEDRLTGYESSPGKTRYFCARCGCHIVASRQGQSHLILRAAALDEDPGLRPALHIWCSHDVPWLGEATDAPRYDAWPAGRS